MNGDLYFASSSATKGFHDSHNLGGGVMVHWPRGVAVMAGAQYDWSPIPAEYRTFDNPTTDFFGLSFGARWDTPWRGLRAGFALVHNWYAEIDVRNSLTQPPGNALAHGGNTEVVVDASYRF